MTSKNLINIKNLSVSFGNNIVLNNINLHLSKKESLVIIGKSGSGKSVLLRCLMGLLKPDFGSIEIDNVDIVNANRIDKEKALRNIGVTFQNGALFDSLNVWENITFKQTRFFGFNKTAAKEKALSIIKNLELNENILELYPSELSGGMQKRIAIARAICDQPQILFFDEPTSGLDPITGKVINDLINKTVRKLGVSAITITHDISSINNLANRVILLDRNKIAWSGRPSDMEISKNSIVQQFLINK
jgi:phospholipid/cholesterol/gamma-HCH transport system ATP-binding protein